MVETLCFTNSDFNASQRQRQRRLRNRSRSSSCLPRHAALPYTAEEVSLQKKSAKLNYKLQSNSSRSVKLKLMPKAKTTIANSAQSQQSQIPPNRNNRKSRLTSNCRNCDNSHSQNWPKVDVIVVIVVTLEPKWLQTSRTLMEQF